MFSFCADPLCCMPRRHAMPASCPQPVSSCFVCSFCSATFSVLWCLVCRLSLCSFFFVPCCVVLPGTSSLRVFLLLFCIRCRFFLSKFCRLTCCVYFALCALLYVFFPIGLSIARLNMAENLPRNKFRRYTAHAKNEAS